MNYIKLVPKLIRTALYLKLSDELARITETDLERFKVKALAAAARVLSL